MYSGIIVFFAPGVALWFRSWIILTVPLVAYIIFKLLIPKEEKYLEEKFGKEYLDYKSKVNAVIPLPRFLK
jgi:protein-S-isoprenylcysteine O-methyltransferase Ste14